MAAKITNLGPGRLDWGRAPVEPVKSAGVSSYPAVRLLCIRKAVFTENTSGGPGATSVRSLETDLMCTRLTLEFAVGRRRAMRLADDRRHMSVKLCRLVEVAACLPIGCEAASSDWAWETLYPSAIALTATLGRHPIRREADKPGRRL